MTSKKTSNGHFIIGNRTCAFIWYFRVCRCIKQWRYLLNRWIIQEGEMTTITQKYSICQKNREDDNKNYLKKKSVKKNDWWLFLDLQPYDKWASKKTDITLPSSAFTLTTLKAKLGTQKQMHSRLDFSFLPLKQQASLSLFQLLHVQLVPFPLLFRRCSSSMDLNANVKAAIRLPTPRSNLESSAK